MRTNFGASLDEAAPQATILARAHIRTYAPTSAPGPPPVSSGTQARRIGSANIAAEKVIVSETLL